jgi:hypothetical protein
MNHLKDQDEVIAFTQELVRRYSPPGQEAWRSHAGPSSAGRIRL